MRKWKKERKISSKGNDLYLNLHRSMMTNKFDLENSNYSSLLMHVYSLLIVDDEQFHLDQEEYRSPWGKSIIWMLLQFKNISHVHWTQRCVCTFVWENERRIDGGERNLSSLPFSHFLPLSLLFSSLLFFILERREREFEILSHIYARTHTHYLLLSCLYTCYRQYIVLWNFRIVESNEPRRRRQRQLKERK